MPSNVTKASMWNSWSIYVTVALTQKENQNRIRRQEMGNGTKTNNAQCSLLSKIADNEHSEMSSSQLPPSGASAPAVSFHKINVN